MGDLIGVLEALENEGVIIKAVAKSKDFKIEDIKIKVGEEYGRVVICPLANMTLNVTLDPDSKVEITEITESNGRRYFEVELSNKKTYTIFSEWGGAPGVEYKRFPFKLNQ